MCGYGCGCTCMVQATPSCVLARPAWPHSRTGRGRVAIATNPPRIRRSPCRLYARLGDVQTGRRSDDPPAKFHDPNDLLSSASTPHLSGRSIGPDRRNSQPGPGPCLRRGAEMSRPFPATLPLSRGSRRISPLSSCWTIGTRLGRMHAMQMHDDGVAAG